VTSPNRARLLVVAGSRRQAANNTRGDATILREAGCPQR
jgi:hypothetical protein